MYVAWVSIFNHCTMQKAQVWQLIKCAAVVICLRTALLQSSDVKESSMTLTMLRTSPHLALKCMVWLPSSVRSPITKFTFFLHYALLAPGRTGTI